MPQPRPPPPTPSPPTPPKRPPLHSANGPSKTHSNLRRTRPATPRTCYPQTGTHRHAHPSSRKPTTPHHQTTNRQRSHSQQQDSRRNPPHVLPSLTRRQVASCQADRSPIASHHQTRSLPVSCRPEHPAAAHPHPEPEPGSRGQIRTGRVDLTRCPLSDHQHLSPGPDCGGAPTSSNRPTTGPIPKEDRSFPG